MNNVNDQNSLENARMHSELLENYDRTHKFIKNSRFTFIF